MKEAKMPSKFEKAYQELVERLEQGVMAPPKPKPRMTAEDRYAARLEWESRQANLPQARRQAAIDAVWERTVAERRRQALEDRQGCHRLRGDPDYDEARQRDPLGIWRTGDE
jgi:hypothetical protein